MIYEEGCKDVASYVVSCRVASHRCFALERLEMVAFVYSPLSLMQIDGLLWDNHPVSFFFRFQIIFWDFPNRNMAGNLKPLVLFGFDMFWPIFSQLGFAKLKVLWEGAGWPLPARTDLAPGEFGSGHFGFQFGVTTFFEVERWQSTMKPLDYFVVPGVIFVFLQIGL